MPKTNLCKPKQDPRLAEAKAVIVAGMTRQDISRVDLSKKTKIPYSTLNYRLRNPGDIRLSELWAMVDALKISEEDRAKII